MKKKHYHKLRLWLKKERNRYRIAGAFFLVLQLLVIYANYNVEKFDVLVWFCNHSPLLFAFAFFMGNKTFIKALINVGFIPQFFWTFDFLGKIIFNRHFLNVTQYVFESQTGIYVLSVILIHMFTTNIALYLTRRKKPNLEVLFYTLIYIIFLFAMSLTYTAETRNVNCVYYACNIGLFTFDSYTNFWPVLIFLFVALPTQGIQYIVYLISKKPHRIH